MHNLESENSEEEGFGYDEEEKEVGGEEMSEEGGNEAGQREGRVRGKDLSWLKIYDFETTLDYLSSYIFKELAGSSLLLPGPSLLTLLKS